MLHVQVQLSLAYGVWDASQNMIYNYLKELKTEGYFLLDVTHKLHINLLSSD